MSKINPQQAAALKAPATKTTATPANKSIVKKATLIKAATTKPAGNTPNIEPIKEALNNELKMKAAKPVKDKVSKIKMERDSFTMPKSEYAQFAVLKERLTKLGRPAKKSELLRAGIMQLTAMTDAALKATMSKVPTIKTGRPKK